MLDFQNEYIDQLKERETNKIGASETIQETGMDDPEKNVSERHSQGTRVHHMSHWEISTWKP